MLLPVLETIESSLPENAVPRSFHLDTLQGFSRGRQMLLHLNVIASTVMWSLRHRFQTKKGKILTRVVNEVRREWMPPPNQHQVRKKWRCSFVQTTCRVANVSGFPAPSKPWNKGSTWSTIIWLSFTLGDVKTLTLNHSWCPAKCVFFPTFFSFRYQTAPENCLVPCYAPLRCLGLIKDAPFRGYPFGLFIDPCILAQDYKIPYTPR